MKTETTHTAEYADSDDTFGLVAVHARQPTGLLGIAQRVVLTATKHVVPNRQALAEPVTRYIITEGVYNELKKEVEKEL